MAPETRHPSAIHPADPVVCARAEGQSRFRSSRTGNSSRSRSFPTRRASTHPASPETQRGLPGGSPLWDTPTRCLGRSHQPAARRLLGELHRRQIVTGSLYRCIVGPVKA